jgi:5'-nucleotidase
LRVQITPGAQREERRNIRSFSFKEPKVKNKKQILLTNDDGIGSPGLRAAAISLADLGHVTVVAPNAHFSHYGRGFFHQATGQIHRQEMEVNRQVWEVFAVDGSPSQTTLHALLEILPQKPDLVVSGINFGENVSIDVTSSGTVGAAFESATFGIPSISSSMQILQEEWNSYHIDVDFSTAAYFTHYFAALLLEKKMPEDVDVLNLTVPVGATPQTPWRITRLARTHYYDHYVKRNGGWEDPAVFSAHRRIPTSLPKDTDVHTVIIDKIVSVTPLSLDLTSRVDFNELDTLFRK